MPKKTAPKKVYPEEITPETSGSVPDDSKLTISEEKKEEEIVIPPDVIDEEKASPLKANLREKKVESDSESAKIKPDELTNSPSEHVDEVELEQQVVDEKVKDDEQEVAQNRITESEVAAPDAIEDTEVPRIEKTNKQLFLLGGSFFIFTIITTTIMGIFILNTSNGGKPKEEPFAVPTEAPAPKSASASTINKKEITFEVLNGSGEAGKAKKTADAIEDLGYTVDGTGNASETDYEGVVVSFVDEIEDSVKEIILKDLKKEFLSVKEDDLPQETDASILLIVGK